MNKNLLDPELLEEMKEGTVYIVAPGPNGNDYHAHIPGDSCVIFVNKAIELLHNGRVKADRAIWMVCEHSVLKTEWFNIHHEAYKDILAVGRAVVAMGVLEEDDYWKVFEYYGNVPANGRLTVDPSGLSVGTTVSGMALQLAWWMGATKAIFCGVDLYGDIYYDGTQGGCEAKKNSPWGMHIHRTATLIDNMSEKRHIDVYSLSPTQLKVDIMVLDE